MAADTSTQTARKHVDLTDDSIRVRQLSHYQFSFVAGDAETEGTFSLQLVLDEGAWEEVLSVTPDDAEVLQNLLRQSSATFYDIHRRTLMFGTRKPGG